MRTRPLPSHYLHLETLEARCLLAASVPLLHSFPGAEHTIYLDFDGQMVESPYVNFPQIHAPPFDVDGQPYDSQGAPTFSEDERNRIVSIWERVSEDYRPFGVDVTTEDPSRNDPTIFQRDGVALRVLFTSKFDEGRGGSGLRWFEGDSNGTSLIESWRYEYDAPVWVFSKHPVGAGEIASHEVGHALGLLHDGDSSQTGLAAEYRGPHGSGQTRWSPIMGQGNVLSQWSKGEYPHANNLQDDVGRIAFGLGRRPDDYVAIQPLHVTREGWVDVAGVISTQGDTDTFSFEVEDIDTIVALEVTPWHNGPNLDVGISLFGLNTGTVIGFSDTTVNPLDRLSSSFTRTLPPGTYFLTVDGVGKPPTLDDPGYTDYGSLGAYRVAGTIGETSQRGDINGDTVISARDIDALHALLRSDAAVERKTVVADLDGNRELDQADVDLLVRELLATEYGDFNLDGRVDFVDFLTLSVNFGQAASGWASGDATGDGLVTFEDFLKLSAIFGFVAKGRGA